MRFNPSTSFLALGTVGLFAAPAHAQFINGLDVSISSMGSVADVAYDASAQAVAISATTTSCNVGSVVANWFRAMDPRHPLICLMMCRLNNDRFVQISNYAYVKHSFASTNSNGCGQCQNPGSGALLGLNCSDTYGVGLNASRTYLGPAEEIDPFTGEWKPIGSYFDRGDPDVGPPFNRDGIESPHGVSTPLGNRCVVSNGELLEPNSQFFCQGMYIVQWEPENVRENDMASHQFTASFSGTSWTINDSSPMLSGNVLQRWPGARIESAANYVGPTAMDGRFYVASKVTVVGGGWYHYEYAVFNRDNHGAGAQFRVPLASGAQVRDIGFHDIDDDSGNEWASTVGGGEIVFDAIEGNIHRWNSIYNFWFESTAGPANGNVTVTQANVRRGANATVDVVQDVPTALTERTVGVGCNNDSPRLFTSERARIPSPNLTAELVNNAPGTNVALHVGFASTNTPVFGCTIFVNPDAVLAGVANGAGEASWPLPIPNDPSLEGIHLYLQGAEGQPSGPLLDVADLSNCFDIRVGNTNP